MSIDLQPTPQSPAIGVIIVALHICIFRVCFHLIRGQVQFLYVFQSRERHIGGY